MDVPTVNLVAVTFFTPDADSESQEADRGKALCTSRAAATVVDSSDRLGRAAALLMRLDLGHAWLLASGLRRNAVRHLMTEKA
jgi:hypothetical protein